jgi:penicillin-binding protein 1A
MTSPLLGRILARLLGFLGDGLRLIKLLLGIVAGVIIFSIALFLGIYSYFARDLPDIRTIEDYRPPVISEAFAADNTKIAEFWTECRVFTPFEEIPKRIVQAFVDSEDSRFFEHKGVDMRSIARAFVANLRAGSVTQGGSTITQQITRSLLLSREKSVARKAKEAILATRLERYLTKDQILTLYLNQIYLGNRAYGVAAAARNYFHRDLKDLSLAQMALIAGLPTAPTNYSPVNNTTEARKRQMHVLGRMVDEGHITKKEMQQALDEPFTVYVAGTDRDFDDPDAAWFTEHVRRLVKDKYGDDVLYHQGLKIYTTVDMPMQRIANATVRHGIESLDRRKGWRGAIEKVPASQIRERADEIANEIAATQQKTIDWPPAAGAKAAPTVALEQGKMYKAIVTGFAGTSANILVGTLEGAIPPEGFKWAHPYSEGGMGSDEVKYVSKPEQVLHVGDVVWARLRADGQFDLAQEPQIQSALMAMDPHTGFIKAMVGGYDFDKSEFNRATQALRQPGSSFKPFAYTAALDKGYTFATPVDDSPVVFTVGKGQTWSPKNYGGGYNGGMTFQNAIKFSRNVPTSKIVYDIGTHYLAGYQRKMGITSPIGKYLSMALGANSVYLLEMVQAYSIFDNGGKLMPATAITKIEDAKGDILESVAGPAQAQENAEAEKDSSPEKDAAPAAEAATPTATATDLETDPNAKVPGRNITASELNVPLFETNLPWMESDKLNLTDAEIKTLYGTSIPPGHVITPQTAFLTVNLLKGVVEGGTGTRAKAIGKPAAGKTGTTNDETDNWFICFVPDLVAGVWVGYDEIKQIAHGATGGTIAAPIWVDFMKAAIADWPAKDFEAPEGFPKDKIATLTGGSVVAGERIRAIGPAPRGGSDRAGAFFDEDYERFGGE